MAWICLRLEDALTQEDPATGELVPLEGAAEATAQLLGEGHRLTVLTDQFARLPPSHKQELKEELELQLQSMGFPPMEVWSGTVMPAADAFIGAKEITYDGDWPLALAQLQAMLEDKGLIQGPMPGDADAQAMAPEVYDTDPSGGEEPPPTEG